MIIELDKLGRIALKKSLRERYGRTFIVVPKEDEIILKPLKIDKEKLAEKLEKYSVSKLKEMAYEQAMKDVEKRLLKKE